MRKFFFVMFLILSSFSSIYGVGLRKGDVVTAFSQTNAASNAVIGAATTVASSGATANNSKVIIKNSNNINSYLTNTQLTNVLGL